MFRQNVGGVDRVLRLTVGGMFFLAGLFLLTSRTRPGVVLTVVGVLALLTGMIRFCVLYVPFGISTAPPKKPRLSQACDCAAWMKAMQDNSAAASPAPPKEESVEVAAATRGR